MAGAAEQEVVVATDKAKRVTVSIRGQTKDSLDSIKHPGQSYDGLIEELIRFWEKGHGVEAAQEKERK